MEKLNAQEEAMLHRQNSMGSMFLRIEEAIWEYKKRIEDNLSQDLKAIPLYVEEPFSKN